MRGGSSELHDPIRETPARRALRTGPHEGAANPEAPSLLSPSSVTLIPELKEKLERAREGGLTSHRSTGSGVVAVHEYTRLVDAILLEKCRTFLDGEQDSVAVVATGGYGRRELCPYSDLDLLFLVQKGKESEGVNRLLRLLWDVGLKPGDATRTPEECYDWMRDDVKTATSLLTCRLLWGSKTLYRRLTESVVPRFVRRRGRLLVDSAVVALRDSLEEHDRTIYVTEPHVKNGVCGLRDIQFVRWIEDLLTRRNPSRRARYVPGPALMDPDVLERAYDFYLRVRCELHYYNSWGLDVLERDSQAAVAINCGFGSEDDPRAAVEALMGEYYRHSRQVYRLLRYYVETRTRPSDVVSLAKRLLFSESLAPFLSLYAGRLSLASEPPNGGSTEEILHVFRVAQKKDALLSASLRESLRIWVAACTEKFDHNATVMRTFVKVLRDGRNVGKLLKAMRDIGLLGRIIPEFAKLDCLVSFDGHHHFTVDEHTLKTLRELDRIATDDGYGEIEFCKVYDEIRDPLPLRLALLFHDIGKGFPGDHSVSGSEIAAMVCGRLGLDEETTLTVEFLVYRHLELFKVSEGRDLSDSGVIETLARLTRTPERLKMLYVLTYIDVTSVGPGVWTRWKGAQLAEVYEKTLHVLETGKISDENLEAKLRASGFNDTERAKILRHCESVNSVEYRRENVPERIRFHAELADEVSGGVPLVVETESFGDYHEFIFCGKDRDSLFADLAGLLYSEGFDVLGARVHSLSGGVALDLFYVEIADGVRVGLDLRLERIRSKIDRLNDKTVVIADVIRERARSFGAGPAPLYGPRVVVDNQSSERYTIIEVHAGDRPGLLFDLALALKQLGLDTRRAKVSTFGERARDSFYVLEEDGGKVDNPARQLEIEQSLLRSAK